jgi:hypothetical protein
MSVAETTAIEELGSNPGLATMQHIFKIFKMKCLEIYEI